MARKTHHPVPSRIGAIPVLVHGATKPQLIHGEEWITLSPSDDDDSDDLWEFSVTTGLLIKAR